MSTTFPKLLLIDRDNTINISSSNPASPFYYITTPSNLILKPGTIEAFEILRALDIPAILVTKQRGLSTGKLSWEQLEQVHHRLRMYSGFQFAEILVEETEETKRRLFERVLREHPELKPEEIALIDDSLDERQAASVLGIQAYACDSLYEGVCKTFDLKM